MVSVASMRACRLVPEPEIRTRMRGRGEGEGVAMVGRGGGWRCELACWGRGMVLVSVNFGTQSCHPAFHVTERQ